MAWTPRIATDMLLTDGLSGAELVLYDIDKQASDLTKAYLDKVIAKLGVSAKVVSTDNRARAFRGAGYFVITISTGGYQAMRHDLAIPEDYSIYHTVGDTTGPGGWARLIRNFDVFVSVATDINRYAPGAMVLNYTNPMTTLTDMLSRLCAGPVVGLCHGLFENLRFIKEFYKLDREDDIAVKYAGLNHFFWITEARAGRIDVMADLARRLKTASFTDLLGEALPDEMGFKSNREVATELFRLTGAMPYLGDRHTSECFSWYITSKRSLKKYKIVRTTNDERIRGFKDRQKQLREWVKGGLDEWLLQRTRETAADIICTHYEGKTFIDVGNGPNVGQVTNLPLGAVVETAIRVDGNGFSPICFGELPEAVLGFVEPYTRVFTMVVDACFAGDKSLALQALRLDPLCAHLNTEQVIEMGERLLRAHRKFVTVF